MSSPDERVEALERDVAALSEAVIALSDSVKSLQRSSPSPVWSWLSTDDPESARVILADLTEWVHRVWLAWPDAELKPCWIQHADVIETLWALHNLWVAHERRGGSWGQRVDWIERYRPAAAARLTSFFLTHRHDEDPVPEPCALPSLSAVEAAADQHCAASPVTP